MNCFAMSSMREQPNRLCAKVIHKKAVKPKNLALFGAFAAK